MAVRLSRRFKLALERRILRCVVRYLIDAINTAVLILDFDKAELCWLVRCPTPRQQRSDDDTW